MGEAVQLFDENFSAALGSGLVSWGGVGASPYQPCSSLPGRGGEAGPTYRLEGTVLAALHHVTHSLRLQKGWLT